MEKELVKIVLAVLFVFSSISSGAIELAGEGFIPEPNEEITVQIQTDTPLFAMGIGIYVVGDANIISAMNPEDCNNYGWDNGWNCVPYIDPNGWVYISGVRWDADANGIIGYFKFRYNSGQVSVYIDQEYSTDIAFDWDSRSSSYVPFSTDTLVFGEPDPNDSGEDNKSSSQDTTADAANDINLPPSGFWQNEQEKRQKYLIRCPADFNSNSGKRETFNKANWQEQFQLEKDSGGGQMFLDSNEPNVIDVNSDITTNQLWTANNVYHITAPINVQALLVIEPNTMVIFGYDCAIFVNNGGTLISKGTPDAPIVYTCDGLYFYYPEGIGYYWEYIYHYNYRNYYFCPMYIEQTASPATTITYSFVEGAYYGILTDNITLDRPIENNYLFGNIYGIFEYGTRHTDIRNNQCSCNYASGIDVNLADVNGIADANSHILIQNNTCDFYQDNGIIVHGVSDANDAGLVILLNNIVSMSYVYGLALNDYMFAIVSNTGYYANDFWGLGNKNGDFNEYDPVEANEFPYMFGPGYLDWYYLDPNCPFINAGLEYVEQTPLIGKTTDINGLPDGNKIDIGFHHPNWNFSNADTDFAAGDFNKDTITDYRDLYTLITNWLSSVEPNSNGDLNNDGTVNFQDFTLFANNWQKIQGHSNIAAIISGDVNSITSSFEVDVNSGDFANGYDFIFMDGQLIAPMSELGGQITIDSYKLRNGVHDLKVVHSGWSGITVSAEQPITFNNLIYCSNISDQFNIHRDYQISGLYDGNGVLNAQITDMNEQVIWSDTDSGIDVNIVVPQNIFSNQMFCSLSITETEAMGMMAGGGESSMTALDSGGSEMSIDLTREFEQVDYDDIGVRMVIVLPDKDVFKPRKPAVYECAKACNNRSVLWVPLYYHDVTKENLTYLFSKPSVKYIYWCGHADSHVGRDERLGIPGVQRTNTQCWKNTDSGWWDFFNNWEQIGVFSYTLQTWSYGYPLPSNWDYRGFDLRSVRMNDTANPMYDTWNKKIVFVDGCLSGYFDDMAQAYGVNSLQGYGSLDQIYIGWDLSIITSSERIGEWFAGDTTEGVRMFWEQMGIQDKSVYDAFHYIEQFGSSQTRKTFFGYIGAIFDNGTGDDNIRIYGHGGGTRLNIIKLNNN